MIKDMDDELTTNVSSTNRGQIFTAATGVATVAGRTKDAIKARDWATGELVVPFAEFPAGAANPPDYATNVKIDIIAGNSVDGTGKINDAAPAVLSTITVLAAAYPAAGVGLLIAMPPLLPGFSKRYLGARVTGTGAPVNGAQLVVGLLEKSARQQVYGDLAGSV